MFPDPNRLQEVSPAEVLDAAASGHLGLDHRFLHAILDRPEESLPAVRAMAERDRSGDAIDLAPEIIAILRHWKTPGSVPFLIGYLKEDPANVPDELIETLVSMGREVLDPLLDAYREMEEDESGEVAFVLASLGIRDNRIMQVLVDRLEYDLTDTLLLLGIYGDPVAIPVLEAIQAKVGDDEKQIKQDLADTLETLRRDSVKEPEEPETFDIWALYPETEELPVDQLGEDERIELLAHPTEGVRAEAAHSFFNTELTREVRQKLLDMARSDDSPTVRGRAWEALINSTEDPEIVEAMLAALRSPELALAERGGLLVALAPEADRNEVREAIVNLYNTPDQRAKALEAMWRSMHPAFRDYFASNLDDPELEVRRGAIWGVGYYGLKAELDRLRKFFTDEELRSDALFAYSLVLPAELSRGRMKGLLSRIEKDAKGLSEMEEELVKAALDERLMLAGKEPIFRQQED